MVNCLPSYKCKDPANLYSIDLLVVHHVLLFRWLFVEISFSCFSWISRQKKWKRNWASLVGGIDSSSGSWSSFLVLWNSGVSRSMDWIRSAEFDPCISVSIPGHQGQLHIRGWPLFRLDCRWASARCRFLDLLRDTSFVRILSRQWWFINSAVFSLHFEVEHHLRRLVVVGSPLRIVPFPELFRALPCYFLIHRTDVIPCEFLSGFLTALNVVFWSGRAGFLQFFL